MATSVTRGNASIAPAPTGAQLVPCGTNLVVLRGALRRDPEYRTLPSGDELLSFDLTIREDDLPAETVPVVWLNPAPRQRGTDRQGARGDGAESALAEPVPALRQQGGAG